MRASFTCLFAAKYEIEHCRPPLDPISYPSLTFTSARGNEAYACRQPNAIRGDWPGCGAATRGHAHPATVELTWRPCIADNRASGVPGAASATGSISEKRHQ